MNKVSLLPLLLLFFVTLSAQPITKPLIDVDGPLQPACVRDDVPYHIGLLLADKQATLESIRALTLQRLQAHLADPYYLDKRAYAHIEIGNIFNSTVKHALIAYLSDANRKGDNDYYMNLYVYEIGSTSIQQVFKAENLSAYYRTIGVDITDFNRDGTPDVVVASNEPEWHTNSRPMRLYYHLFQYMPAPGKPLLTEFKPLLQIPNPKFLTPQIVYSSADCGCSGSCWFSQLFALQKDNTFRQIAEANQYCTNVASVYRLNKGNRTLIAEMMQAGTGDSQYLERVWNDLLPGLLPDVKP